MEEMAKCPICNGEGKLVVNVYKKKCWFCEGKGTIRVVDPLL